MSTEARDAAIRDTKLYVREIVRNDWTFEPSTDSGLPARSSPLNPVHEVSEWRLREYDSSGSELEPSAIGSRDPTGYDSSQPSSPVLSPTEGRTERRRKRRRKMEEEMRWNEGLRTWVERRDAWSGARTRMGHRTAAEEQHSLDGVCTTGTAVPATASGLESASQDTFSGSTSSRPLSSRSHESPPTTLDNLAARAEGSLHIADHEDREFSLEQQSQPDRDGEDHSADQDAKRKASIETAITEPDPSHKSLNASMPVATPTPAPDTVAATAMASSIPHTQSCESEDPLIPVVPSLISDANPIRASITPSMYPSIYSKVVIQGLTPTVPINLADVTKAMVQGWKSDGQWPPKPTNIVLADDATVPRVNNAADKPSSPESKRRSGVASAVRKVLNFSGFHPHPFHRRGSTSHNNEHHEGEATSSVAAGSANVAHPEKR